MQQLFNFIELITLAIILFRALVFKKDKHDYRIYLILFPFYWNNWFSAIM